jgi:hypothetical protein
MRKLKWTVQGFLTANVFTPKGFRRFKSSRLRHLTYPVFVLLLIQLFMESRAK